MIVFFILLMAYSNIHFKIVQAHCTSKYCDPWRTPIPNMDAALVGYNPFLGNRLMDGKSDPGMCDQIFEGTTTNTNSDIILASNIHVYDSENCQVAGETSVTNNYQEYKSKKVSHVTSLEESEDNVSAKVSSSFFVKVEATFKASSSKSSSSSKDFEKETAFFSETSGEIYIHDVHCEVYNVKVSPFEKPIFTSAFISAMQALNKAAKNPNSNSSNQIVKKFIKAYGTHYQSDSWLGASLTTETRSASKSKGHKDQQKKSDCIKEAHKKSMSAGLSVKGGAYGFSISAGHSHNEESNKCLSNDNDNNFHSKNDFSKTKIISRGSPPIQDVNQWSSVIKEGPLVIRLNILPIKNLFTFDWIGKIPATNDATVKEYLDAKRMYDYLDNAVENYCQTMFDRECITAKGCGINSNCNYLEICENDNSTLGFKCVEGTVMVQRRHGSSNPPNYFSKSFAEYKEGFSANGELWIGLDKLHTLTTEGSYGLVVKMTDWDDKQYTAVYSNITVGPGYDYVLEVSGFDKNSSTLGDSMISGIGFSTRDRDVDNYSQDCSKEMANSGWWFWACSYTLPTGLNEDTQMNGYKYIHWYYGGDRGSSLDSFKEALFYIVRN